MRYKFMLLLILCSATIGAQVLVNAVPPYGNFNIDQMHQVTLTNYGSNQELGFVRSYLSDGDDELIQVVSDVVNISPGQTVQSYQISWFTNILFAQHPAAIVFQNTGNLIPGDYLICYEFVSLEDNSIRGEFCQEFTEGQFVDFELLSPYDGEEIFTQTPFLSWEPYWPLLNGGNFDYWIVLKEVYPGQSPLEAMAANPVYYTQELGVNTMIYSSINQPLVVGERYVWQVHVVNRASGNVMNSTSIWAFQILGPFDPNSPGNPEVTPSFPLISSHPVAVIYLNRGPNFKFAYDNWEQRKKLEYRIYPVGEQELEVPNLPQIDLVTGLNTVDLNLLNLPQITPDTDYYLEIRESERVFLMTLMVR